LKKHDYSLPKPWTEGGLSSMEATMCGRSLAPLFAFKGHRRAIANPLSYIKTNRQDHPFDELLIPKQQ